MDGIPVITALDLADVPVNAITRYYFLAGVAQGTINYHVPVFVARGTNASLHTGRMLSLSSTVHGDEYNGVRVVQNVFRLLEETVTAGGFNGTIIGIPTVNMNGIMHNQRNCTVLPSPPSPPLSLFSNNPIRRSLLQLRKRLLHQPEPRLPGQRPQRPDRASRQPRRLRLPNLERPMGQHHQRRRRRRSS